MPDYRLIHRRARWTCILSHLDAPRACGVYAVYEDGRLTYIGSSVCLRSRLGIHVRGTRFTQLSHLKFRRCQDGFAARRLERRLLQRLRPEKNRVINVGLVVRGRAFNYHSVSY